VMERAELLEVRLRGDGGRWAWPVVATTSSAVENAALIMRSVIIIFLFVPCVWVG